jgi:hypothetical protein
MAARAPVFEILLLTDIWDRIDLPSAAPVSFTQWEKGRTPLPEQMTLADVVLIVGPLKDAEVRSLSGAQLA